MASTEAAAQAGQTAEQKLVLAHKALLKTPGLQFDFGAVPPPEKPPGWVRPLIEFLASLGPVLQYVFWGGLAVGAALIIYFIAREYVPDAWLRKTRVQRGVTDWKPEEGKARALLEDADALAAAGRFEEAIHLRLVRSIDDLVSRRPGAVRPALTSRDIAGLEVVPGDARAAFVQLAQAVERTFFGGRPADADEFGRARRDYEAFAFAEGWR